jgi:hypothetical protein
MSEPAFLTSIKEALSALDMAQVEAEAELPDEIKGEYQTMMQSRQVVDPYHALFWQHSRIPALDALAFISEMRAKARGLEIRTKAVRQENEREAQGLPRHDLSLGKMRQH